MKVLVTCFPMLGLMDEFIPYARLKGIELVPLKSAQTVSEDALIQVLPEFDGWIIGNHPATYRAFEAGRHGCLKAAVKWGIGVDKVDFAACERLGIHIVHTPNMFGGEVADVAVGYLIGLARRLFLIDRAIRLENSWPKPIGMSLAGKRVGLIGFGDIGRNVAKRVMAFDMEVTAYDPGVVGDGGFPGIVRADWPARIEEADFLVFTCSLHAGNRHMLNCETLARAKSGVFVVNVARGALINERALIAALRSGHVRAAALDVFEQEPLPLDSPLRSLPQCVLGSHNSANTQEAVRRASYAAMRKLFEFLQKGNANP